MRWFAHLSDGEPAYFDALTEEFSHLSGDQSTAHHSQNKTALKAAALRRFNLGSRIVQGILRKGVACGLRPFSVMLVVQIGRGVFSQARDLLRLKSDRTIFVLF